MADIFSLLDTVPGAFFSHLSVTFILLGVFTILAAVDHQGDKPAANRMLAGIGAVLGLRLVLFVVALLIAGNIIQPGVLPPLERGIRLIGAGIAIWIWAFPEPDSQSNWAVLLSSFLFGLLTILGALIWSGDSTAGSFNAHWIDLSAGLATVLAAVLGILLLFLRRPGQWVFGIIFFALVLAGEILHLAVPSPEMDFAVASRLAQITAYPLLFALPLRIFRSRPGGNRANIQPSVYKTINPKKKYNIEPFLLEQFLELANEDQLKYLYEKVTRIVAYSFVSDICFIISLDLENEVFIVPAGYDLILEKQVPNSHTTVINLPLVFSAMDKLSSLRAQARSNAPDLQTLGTTLGSETPGNLLLTPLKIDFPKYPPTAIGLFSPYSNRNWDNEEQSDLERIARSLSRIIQGILDRSIESDAPSAQNPEHLARLDELQSKISTLEGTLQDYKKRIETTANQTQVERQNADATIEQLRDENLRLLDKVRQMDQAPPAKPNGGRLKPTPSEYEENTPRVNLNSALDSAIASIQNHIREKNLVLRVDIASPLPEVSGDHSAIEKTLQQLMKNAAEVTSPEQEIAIQAVTNSGDGKTPQIKVTISDSGGGISAEDLPKIFDPLYTQNIPGLGETAKGLSASRKLIMENNGEIWAESTPDVGTLFHILLPALPLQPD